MTRTAAFIIIIALRLIYQPSQAQRNIAPFTNYLPAFAASVITPAKLINVQGSLQKNKVTLEWTVSENETADTFEIEKSTDGKNFSLAALVFGSDLPATGAYKFFEKAPLTKMSYRIKLVSKDKQAEYSPIIEIIPGV